MEKKDILQKIAEKERKYSIPSGFLEAVVSVESNFNPKALGGAQEIGLVQILPKGGAIADFEQITGKTLDYWDVENNLEVGAWYLGKRIPDMLKRFNQPDTIPNRIVAYNAGIGNLIKGIVPKTTRNYIAKVEKYLGTEKKKVTELERLFCCSCGSPL